MLSDAKESVDSHFKKANSTIHHVDEQIVDDANPVIVDREHCPSTHVVIHTVARHL